MNEEEAVGSVAVVQNYQGPAKPSAKNTLADDMIEGVEKQHNSSEQDLDTQDREPDSDAASDVESDADVTSGKKMKVSPVANKGKRQAPKKAPK